MIYDKYEQPSKNKNNRMIIEFFIVSTEDKNIYMSVDWYNVFNKNEDLVP